MKLALALLLAAVSAPALAQTEAAGTYLRSDPAPGRLEISRKGEVWHVVVEAQGYVNTSGYPAARCYFEADGSLRGDTLVATVVPVDSEYALSPGATYRVQVSLDGGMAELIAPDLTPLCGTGSNVLGRYVKPGS